MGVETRWITADVSAYRYRSSLSAGWRWIDVSAWHGVGAQKTGVHTALQRCTSSQASCLAQGLGMLSVARQVVYVNLIQTIFPECFDSFGASSHEDPNEKL